MMGQGFLEDLVKSPGAEATAPKDPEAVAERQWDWGDATDWTNSLLDFGTDALNIGGIEPPEAAESEEMQEHPGPEVQLQQSVSRVMDSAQHEPVSA